MTRDEIDQAVRRNLAQVAPEADLARLRPTVPLRQQLDLDSMDFLNFVIALHKELNVDVPERDYGKLATLQGCIDYLAGVLEGR